MEELSTVRRHVKHSNDLDACQPHNTPEKSKIGEKNAAARLLMSCKKCDHITPVLINLHWLPVRYRINFKILLLTFKALYGMAPSYIIDLIHIKTNTRYLLLSNGGVLLKHPSGKMTKSFGDRSFSVAAPTLWNALPVSPRSIKCISTFKSSLKTYLFKLAFNIS